MAGRISELLEIGVGPPQRLFFPAALGYIHRGSEKTDGRASWRTENSSRGLQPSSFPVGPQCAKFHRARLAGIDREPNAIVEAIAIVRMNEVLSRFHNLARTNAGETPWNT